MELSPNDIKTGIDGRPWIISERHKTKKGFKVPLLEIPLMILKKYENEKIHGKLLPVTSNQKINTYLKEIADLCDIKQNLTFHLARHTFATLGLSKGIPITTISKMLGHSKVSTTEIYARLIPQKISEDMTMFSKKINGMVNEFKSNNSDTKQFQENFTWKNQNTIVPELFIIKEPQGKTHLCYLYEERYCDLANPMLDFAEGEDEFEIIQPDFSYKNKTYNYWGQKLCVKMCLYDNGWPAIYLENPNDPADDYCLTVNLEEMSPIGLPARTFVDINNHPKAMDFLIKNGFATDMGYNRRNGFVEYPMVTLNFPLLYQHYPNVFIDYCEENGCFEEEECNAEFIENKKTAEKKETEGIQKNINNYLSETEPTPPKNKVQGKSLS